MNAPESPAVLLRRAAEKLRAHAEAAKELTGDGRGRWFPWGTVTNTAWRQFPEPREVPAAPYPFGDGGTELAEGEYVPTGEAFVAHDRWAHDQHEDWHEPVFFAGPVPEALAEYIALMDPGVGLALAEWLEAEAKRAAENVIEDRPECGHDDACSCDNSPGLSCDLCSEWLAPGGCKCWDRALATARAVLGETETERAGR